MPAGRKHAYSYGYLNYYRESLGKHLFKRINKSTKIVDYEVRFGGKVRFTMTFDNLRDAQLKVDKILISNGKEPIYILKRK